MISMSKRRALGTPSRREERRWVPSGAEDLGDEAKIMGAFGWTEENLNEVERYSEKED